MADRTLGVELAQDTPFALDVQFTCAAGEVLGIFGPSGSGKTTILRTIAGLHRPARSRVTSGADVWSATSSGTWIAPEARRTGFVFQHHALFPHMTALGNVMAALGHRPAAERAALAHRLLDDVQLGDKAGRRPDALSGGEQQRVAVARALAREPSVLLLDEPFASIDRATRRHLQDLVDRLRRRLDVPVVLVTHDFDDIVRLATHLLVLEHGRVRAAGPLRDVTSQADAGWPVDAAGRGVVFDASVESVDGARGLAEIAFDGGRLVAPASGYRAGTCVRVRIPAREVILASSPPGGLSLHNALAGTTADIHDDATHSEAIVRVAVGGEYVLAEVTRDAVSRLALAPGVPVWVLIKSMSLDVTPVAGSPACNASEP